MFINSPSYTTVPSVYELFMKTLHETNDGYLYDESTKKTFHTGVLELIEQNKQKSLVRGIFIMNETSFSLRRASPFSLQGAFSSF